MGNKSRPWRRTGEGLTNWDVNEILQGYFGFQGDNYVQGGLNGRCSLMCEGGDRIGKGRG